MKSLFLKSCLIFLSIFFSCGILYAQSLWSSGTNGGIYYNSGNVGIGTSSPAAKLQVDGNVLSSGSFGVNGSSPSGNIVFTLKANPSGGVAGIYDYNGNLRAYPFYLSSSDAAQGYYYDNNGSLKILLNTIGKSYFTGGGLGVGTSSLGNYMLNVAGGIRADSVVVNTTGADFVFNRSYHMMSLDNLGKYVKKYRHLPGIPTARQMDKGGVSVGALQTKLLQKVEELTLYVVQENKKIEELQKENAQLSARK